MCEKKPGSSEEAVRVIVAITVREVNVAHQAYYDACNNRLLSTHADRQGVNISFAVCLFCMFFVCIVTDFSGEDKASGVKFCTPV